MERLLSIRICGMKEQNKVFYIISKFLIADEENLHMRDTSTTRIRIKRQVQCVGNVRIRYFAGTYFLVFELNTAIYLRENTDQKKLRIQTFFRQWFCLQ